MPQPIVVEQAVAMTAPRISLGSRSRLKMVVFSFDKAHLFMVLLSTSKVTDMSRKHLTQLVLRSMESITIISDTGWDKFIGAAPMQLSCVAMSGI